MIIKRVFPLILVASAVAALQLRASSADDTSPEASGNTSAAQAQVTPAVTPDVTALFQKSCGDSPLTGDDLAAIAEVGGEIPKEDDPSGVRKLMYSLYAIGAARSKPLTITSAQLRCGIQMFVDIKSYGGVQVGVTDLEKLISSLGSVEIDPPVLRDTTAKDAKGNTIKAKSVPVIFRTVDHDNQILLMRDKNSDDVNDPQVQKTLNSGGSVTKYQVRIQDNSKLYLHVPLAAEILNTVNEKGGSALGLAGDAPDRVPPGFRDIVQKKVVDEQVYDPSSPGLPPLYMEAENVKVHLELWQILLDSKPGETPVKSHFDRGAHDVDFRNAVFLPRIPLDGTVGGEVLKNNNPMLATLTGSEIFFSFTVKVVQ